MKGSLTVVRGLVAAGVVLVAGLVIGDMGEASRSQGGAFYVGIGAVLAVGGLESVFRRLLRRTRPLALGTSDEDRRDALVSAILVLLSALVLLGIAGSKPDSANGGVLLGLAGLGGAVIAAAGAIYGLKRLADRGIDRAFAGSRLEESRTFRLSFGSPPGGMPGLGGEPGRTPHMPAATPAPDPEILKQYDQEWEALGERFWTEPAAAVRDAHAFVLRLTEALGRRPVFQSETDLTKAGPHGLREVGRSVVEGRAASRGVNAALRGEDADPEALRAAMRQYSRVVGRLLRGE